LIEEISRGAYDSVSQEAIEKRILPADYELFQAVVKRRHHEHLIQKYNAKRLRRYIKNAIAGPRALSHSVFGCVLSAGLAGPEVVC
jgi:hypothetical protein